MLLVAPIVAFASSGLPPTISMYPESAGPGTNVELTGIDFPGGRVVDLQLTTTDGSTPLATTTTAAGGEFRQIVTLPVGMPDGSWEITAQTADGSSATLTFATSEAAALAAAAAAAGEAEAEVPAGNSGTDVMVMLVIALVLGAIAFGALVAYRQFMDETPPGMGKGDDLIWGGGSKSEAPEQTATEEPHWKAASSES